METFVSQLDEIPGEAGERLRKDIPELAKVAITITENDAFKAIECLEETLGTEAHNAVKTLISIGLKKMHELSARIVEKSNSTETVD